MGHHSCFLCINIFCGCVFLTSRDGNFKYILLESGTYEISEYTGSETVLVFPTEYNGKAVTRIGDSAFCGKKEITEVSLPDSILSIGDSAFEKCLGLERVVMVDGLTTIGEYAFKDCGNVTKIAIPDTVTYIGQGAISGCASLKYDKYNEDVKTKYLGHWLIGPTQKSISEVNIDANTVGIYGYAFNNCVNLTKVTIPEAVVYIGINAFENCTTLVSLNVLRLSEEGVVVLGLDALSGCTALTNIFLPDAASVEAYKVDPNWSAYANMIKIKPE